MNTVGIRELKAKLSSFIDLVKSGEEIIVTEHGAEVAVINPISKERRAIQLLAKEGVCHWSGGKPRGLEGIKVRGSAISETILEERQ